MLYASLHTLVCVRALIFFLPGAPCAVKIVFSGKYCEILSETLRHSNSKQGLV